MKLICAKQGIELRLDENQVNTLVLENPAIFSEFLQNLISQLEGNEGELILSEGDKIYPISKTVAFLANPLSVDCNEKKIITKLYKELEDNVKNDMYEKYSIFHSEVLNFLERIVNTVPYHLQMDIDINIAALLKAYNVKVAETDVEPLERLIDYLRALRSICGIQVMIILNLKQFFTKSQLQQLYEFCYYQKIYLIQLEGRKTYTIEGEKYVIIDEDMCMIEA